MVTAFSVPLKDLSLFQKWQRFYAFSPKVKVLIFMLCYPSWINLCVCHEVRIIISFLYDTSFLWIYLFFSTKTSLFSSNFLVTFVKNLFAIYVCFGYYSFKFRDYYLFFSRLIYPFISRFICHWISFFYFPCIF